jgi:PKD repeat protein
MKAQALAFAVFAVLSGCSSCQPSEEGRPEAGSAASETVVEPTAAAPAEQPPIAPVPEQPAADAEDTEDDCFVILDASPDYGPPPLKVELAAEVDCTSGEPAYLWDFGDGSPTSGEVSPVHTYAQAGDYTASVVVTGPRGGTDSDEIDILVEE